jgi:murein tripeptide amidase MpaA
MCGLNIY